MTPLSDDPAKRERQLANLRRGGATAGKFVEANTAAVTHGGFADASIDPVILGEREQSIADALAASAPHLRSPAFRPAIRAIALMAVQIDLVRGYLARHGRTDDRGRWRPENQLLDVKLTAYLRALGDLGATPAAAARLGLDQARALDLARAWADEDDAGVVEGG